MGGIDRRLETLERLVEGRVEARLVREALEQLSDEELEALEESLLAEARARGEQPPPKNELLQKMKRWEAETIEQQKGGSRWRA